MLEDRLLIWKFKHGSEDALRCMYEKYKNDLLALAVSLSNDAILSEDAVHDVFVSVAKMGARLELRGSLKSYLLTCISNRIRSLKGTAKRRENEHEKADISRPDSRRPDELAMSVEELHRVGDALMQLPYEQREAVLLRLHGGLTFREIASMQDISTGAVQARYRYGLRKLRSILNSKVQE
ncbi:MAG: RNA polymerase sigma factor [Phycisphaerales bacterium]|nr:MAG: RNA polymerase sigma factor [Phycisphaerales bacterium]